LTLSIEDQTKIVTFSFIKCFSNMAYG